MLMLTDWKPQARSINNAVIDRMVSAIHMVVEMRAEDKPEDTITLSLAERAQLLTDLFALAFSGTLAENEDD